MTVYESKTKHIKNGIRKKYIIRNKTQDAIAKISKQSDYLIQSQTSKSIREINKQLRELYSYLKVDKLHLENQDDDATGYFMKKPTRALRHCSCQLWMRRLGVGAMALVAKIGDWNTVDECIASYGEISDEDTVSEMQRLMNKKNQGINF